MKESWPDLVEEIRLRGRQSSGGFQLALNGVEAIATLIAEGQIGLTLFGWTSMFDLCIQQTEVAPYSGPYLRISPLPAALVALRYHDTAVSARQWHREVPPESAVAMFEAFLEQLHWVPAPGDVPPA
jgi:hypothetical protein